MKEKPYLVKEIVKKTKVRLHNPNYDQNALCKCGHPYHRHFDGFEDPEHADVGCKYCGCHTFRPAKS